MSDYNDYSASSQTSAAEYDEGLRAYMLKVYNYMAGGVALTGIVSFMLGNYFLSNVQAAQAFFTSPLYMIAMFSPFAFILALSFGINRMNSGTAQLVFWAFAAIMGVSMSSIFLMYTGQSIARIFFITMIMFASLSAWGYTTKKDLSAMGTFMFMGLIGLIVAMIVNMFLQSSALSFGISVIGVMVFAGLTAWDNQRIKEGFYQVAGDAELASKSAIMGALSLYLDFINMFLFLLRLFGGGRD
jgi:uncharacterized protein